MVAKGKVNIEEVEYSLNDEFKQAAIRMAENLDMDEVQAVELLLSVEGDAEVLGRSVLETAHFSFHARRKDLLGCLRLILKFGADEELNETVRSQFHSIGQHIIKVGSTKPQYHTPFAQRCLLAMAEIRRWVQELDERDQTPIMMGSILSPEAAEIMTFQKNSLLMQCEDLGAILLYLVQLGFSDIQCFEDLLETVKSADKYDIMLVFYMPSFVASMCQFGSPEGRVSFSQARSLHDKITSIAHAESWPLRFFRAAAVTWWLSEYSGWFMDPHEQVTTARIDVDRENEAHNQLLSEALKDGALDFVLSLCADVKSAETTDTIRSALRQSLQKKAPALPSSPFTFSVHFQLLLKEQLETYVDAFITNMPASLRRLRVDQDERRLRLLDLDPEQQEMDLEKFLLIIAHIFENRPDAVRAIWSFPDSNYYGFLQWSSKRLSTPRACAVCEMLISLSYGEENASSAHQFLLDESTAPVAKLRRSSSLSWAQILQELRYSAMALGDTHTIAQRNDYRSDRAKLRQSLGEPETNSMLESYLRLTATICGQSPTARIWLLSQSTLPLLDLLFSICGAQVPTRLRACAFDTMVATLVDKPVEYRDSFWSALDNWVNGALPLLQDRSKLSGGPGPPWKPETMFSRITEGFEESVAFVALLTTLISPCTEGGPLNDSLPFAETLGMAYRMPGIEPYIDFVLGRLFVHKTAELQDISQQRYLMLRCLDFVLTSLSTFNVNLFDFLHESKVDVDSAIACTSLAVYARLHPFSRVMDWLFNDGVLQVLFGMALQDIQAVSEAPGSSLLVLCLLRTIEVMSAILELQSTYRNAVRPLLADDVIGSPSSIANASWASFEDVVLQKLDLLCGLGLYATTGHHDLAIAALALLEKLATSSKLVNPNALNVEHGTGRSKTLAIFEKNSDSERVSRSMVLMMLPDFEEQKKGSESPAYDLKHGILKFLKHCLESSPDRPNLAHLFLGFACRGSSIEIEAGTSFADETSLFRAAKIILSAYPDGMENSLRAWLLDIKQQAFAMFRILWESRLSATYALTELRAQDFLSDQLMRLHAVDVDTLFEGRTITDPAFLSSNSAECCNLFLRQRVFLLEYIAVEMRVLAEQRVSTLKARTVSSILGTIIIDEGDHISCLSIIDLFDFSEIDIDDLNEPSIHEVFSDLNLDVCLEIPAKGLPAYNLHKLEQLFTLRLQEAIKAGRLSQQDEPTVERHALQLILYHQAVNNQAKLLHTKLDLLKTWTEVVILILEIGDLDATTKEALVLQMLQIVLPKLERYSRQRPTEALELARLSKTLLLHVKFDSPFLGKGQANDVAADRLHHLFLVSLRGIHAPTATSQLRELFYVICHRYCFGICDAWQDAGARSWLGTRALKASGEALMTTVCDDAQDGDDLCRMSALLFLEGLILLSQKEDSTYVIDTLTRMNFLGLLVDSIRVIPVELQESQAQGKRLGAFALNRLDLSDTYRCPSTAGQL